MINTMGLPSTTAVFGQAGSPQNLPVSETSTSAGSSSESVDASYSELAASQAVVDAVLAGLVRECLANRELLPRGCRRERGRRDEGKGLVDLGVERTQASFDQSGSAFGRWDRAGKAG